MTTKISVVTHDWPVEITKTLQDGEEQSRERVESNSDREFWLSEGLSLTFKELPTDE